MKYNAERVFLSISETDAPYNLYQDFSYLAFNETLRSIWSFGLYWTNDEWIRIHIA
jgi:hypothetical protein